MGLLKTLAVAALPVVGQLPTLPQLPLPVNANRTLSTVTDLASVPLTDVRRLHIRDLLRQNSRVLEADPAGAPIVRSEVLALSPSEDALERARGAGFSVIRERVLTGLDARIVVNAQAPQPKGAQPKASPPKSGEIAKPEKTESPKIPSTDASASGSALMQGNASVQR